MTICLSLANLPFREGFEKAVQLYPCEIQGDTLRMSANVVQCMEVATILTLYQRSVEKPDWGGGYCEETPT